MSAAGDSQARPDQPSEPGSTEGAGWAADFPADQAEAASGHSGQDPQTMQQNDPDTERTPRQQAEGQGDESKQQGLGYGAEDGEEMSDAPDASDPSQRGYGGAGEQRLKKLQGDS